ncbi:hypothetical protein D3C77_705760 [compost metagenome]
MVGVQLFEFGALQPHVQQVLVVVRVDQPEQAVGIAAPPLLLPVLQQFVRQAATVLRDAFGRHGPLMGRLAHGLDKHLEKCVLHH